MNFISRAGMYDKVDQSLTPSPKKKHPGEPYLLRHMYELQGKFKVQIPPCNVPLILIPRAGRRKRGLYIYIFFLVEGVAEADMQKETNFT